MITKIRLAMIISFILVIGIILFVFIPMFPFMTTIVSTIQSSDNSVSTITLPSDNSVSTCKATKQLFFTDIQNNIPCAAISYDPNYSASYILFIRHCDRGYNTDPKAKGFDPISNNCGQMNNTSCLGCQHMDSESVKCVGKICTPTCASNDCSDTGVKRSWALGKWIDCFAKDNNVEIGAVVGQNFVPGSSNRRPQTTASIIYESLTNLGHKPCWILADKNTFKLHIDSKTKQIKDFVHSNVTNKKLVVVVWDHGDLTNVIQNVTTKKLSGGWSECCFDQVVVMDHIKSTLTPYNAKSLQENDLCGNKCNNPNNVYKKKDGTTCSYINFGDQTPCSKNVTPSSNCYGVGEKPFDDKCKKQTKCCNDLHLCLDSNNTFSCQHKDVCTHSKQPDCKKYPPINACKYLCPDSN
jgi:hypothetical protein